MTTASVSSSVIESSRIVIEGCGLHRSYLATFSNSTIVLSNIADENSNVESVFKGSKQIFMDIHNSELISNVEIIMEDGQLRFSNNTVFGSKVTVLASPLSSTTENAILVENNFLTGNMMDLLKISAYCVNGGETHITVRNNSLVSLFSNSNLFDLDYWIKEYFGSGPFYRQPDDSSIVGCLNVYCEMVQCDVSITSNKIRISGLRAAWDTYPNRIPISSAIMLVATNGSDHHISDNESNKDYYYIGVFVSSPSIDVACRYTRREDMHAVARCMRDNNSFMGPFAILVQLCDHCKGFLKYDTLIYKWEYDYIDPSRSQYNTLNFDMTRRMWCNNSLPSFDEHSLGCTLSIEKYSMMQICNEITIFDKLDKAMDYCATRSGQKGLVVGEFVVTRPIGAVYSNLYLVNIMSEKFTIYGNGSTLTVDGNTYIYVFGNIEMVNLKIKKKLSYGGTFSFFSKHQTLVGSQNTLSFKNCEFDCVYDNSGSFASYICDMFSEDTDYYYTTLRYYNSTFVAFSRLTFTTLHELTMINNTAIDVTGSFINSYIFRGFTISNNYVELREPDTLETSILKEMFTDSTIRPFINIMYYKSVDLESLKARWYSETQKTKKTGTDSAGVNFLNVLLKRNTVESYPFVSLGNIFVGASTAFNLYYGDTSDWRLGLYYVDERYSIDTDWITQRTILENYTSSVCGYKDIRGVYYNNHDIFAYTFNVTCIVPSRGIYRPCFNDLFCRETLPPVEHCYVGSDADNTTDEYGQINFRTVQDALRLCSSILYEKYYTPPYSPPVLSLRLGCGEHLFYKPVFPKNKRTKKGYSTAGSQVVSNLSTDAARRCLTSQIGRDEVHSS
ncbi:hypothetical protein FDP41_009336 [Naegleria fowleri]|uniref:Uncharacterized protein n=1 Tax=Naegleria fowleri TaxID=5763 RepID=A0A6A5AXQ0_NAEFO|nr:hypothetical protein FDP41_009336 [Naegleria fowleri]